jgi:hypothetical protein
MKTKAVIFTCLKHYGAASIAAEAASKHFDIGIIILPKNADVLTHILANNIFNVTNANWIKLEE